LIIEDLGIGEGKDLLEFILLKTEEDKQDIDYNLVGLQILTYVKEKRIYLLLYT
jgi:hypothetical protein